MQHAKQEIDPGFWIGLLLVALLLYATIMCK